MSIKDNVIRNNNQGTDTNNSGVVIKTSGTSKDLKDVTIQDNDILGTLSRKHAFGIEMDTGTGVYEDIHILNNKIKGYNAARRMALPPDVTKVDGNGAEGDTSAGTESFSGDGTTTTFVIPAHRLDADPSDQTKVVANVTPVSADAKAAAPVSAYPADDDTDGNYEALEVVFASAPASGSNNVTVRWDAAIDGS